MSGGVYIWCIYYGYIWVSKHNNRAFSVAALQRKSRNAVEHKSCGKTIEIHWNFYNATVAFELPKIDSCTKRARTETSRKIIADTMFQVTMIPIMSNPILGRTF